MTPGPDLKKRGADAARALVIGLPRGNARRVALSAFVEAQSRVCLQLILHGSADHGFGYVLGALS